jgi:hypothetical protein
MSNRAQLVGPPVRPITMVADPADIENPALQFFLSYWREKRGAARLPLRSAFSSKDIGARLPWVTVADALPDYVDFRYRVMGSRIDEYFLASATGMTVTEAFTNLSVSMGRFVLSMLQKTCIDGVPIRLMGPEFVVNNKYFPDYDTLYLPFSSDGERADRVVNVFVFSAEKIFATRVPEVRLLAKR